MPICRSLAYTIYETENSHPVTEEGHRFELIKKLAESQLDDDDYMDTGDVIDALNAIIRNCEKAMDVNRPTMREDYQIREFWHAMDRHGLHRDFVNDAIEHTFGWLRWYRRDGHKLSLPEPQWAIEYR